MSWYPLKPSNSGVERKESSYDMCQNVRDARKDVGEESVASTGCPKSLGHISTLNMSKTIKEITMHLIYSESLQSQVFYRMFKDVQCELR